jgi:succinate dehydrogenase / fumarate reductase cytochrome b subunit
MTWIFRAFSRSIGKKQLMALTGLALTAFLVAHLAGNFLVFAGPDTFNGYSAALEGNPLLIPAEVVLLLVYVLHVLLAIAVTIENRKARPVSYVTKRREGGKTLASATMLYSGIIIFVFVVLHLITFKFADREGTTLYDIEVRVFQSLPYVIWYVFAVAVVGLHVSHGFQSSFRTLGLVHPKYLRIVDRSSRILGLALAVGYASIPIWVFLFKDPTIP